MTSNRLFDDKKGRSAPRPAIFCIEKMWFSGLSAHPEFLSTELLLCWARAAQEVAANEGVGDASRVVFNTGAGAGQTVFHVHAHVIGGRNLEWPPG